MNYKKLIIASIAGFIAVAAFEMLWHGPIMKDMYEATANVWRPESEYTMGYMAYIFISQFLFAVAMAVVYSIVRPALKCKVGIQFGFLTGIILAAPALGTYCYMPIPLSISLMWMLASLLKCLVCGVVVAFVYKER